MNGGRPILFVTNIPSPYQLDFFGALNTLRPSTFYVIFSAASESDRFFEASINTEFQCSVLASRGPRWTKDWHRNAEVANVLDSLEPRLIVIGGSYFMPDARTARAYSLRRQIPFIYWGESPQKKGSAGLKARLKRSYLRRFLKPAAGVIGIGSQATRCYADLLPESRPTENIPYAPNLDRLLCPTPELQSAARRVRQKWLNGRQGPVVLFAGTLCQRKGPDLLFAAFDRVANVVPDACLVYVGDGPVRKELETVASRSSIYRQVRFEGFLHGDALRAAYLAADLFVLPSRWHEGWGVVVQEAMAAGLPVIVSDIVGAGIDLVQNSETGYRCDAGNSAALTSALSLLATDAILRERLGKAGRERVKATSAMKAAEKFCAYADLLLSQRH